METIHLQCEHLKFVLQFMLISEKKKKQAKAILNRVQKQKASKSDIEWAKEFAANVKKAEFVEDTPVQVPIDEILKIPGMKEFALMLQKQGL